MEPWQWDYVGEKLGELCAVTKCTVILLARLRSRNILALEDVETIKHTDKLKGTGAKTLYTIVRTRRNGYSELINALQEGGQFEAVKILRNGIPANAGHGENLIRYGKISFDPTSILGDGEITKVFKGYFERRAVAVKRITCDQSEADKFYNEIQILVDLGVDAHPNIVSYFDSVIAPNAENEIRIFVALELCDISLSKWAYPDTDVELQVDLSKVNILQQITAGVDFIHYKKIIHRDIKPENILLKRVGENIIAKIADFGISRKLPDGRTCVTNRTSSGTDGWMAPEILRWRKNQQLTRQFAQYSAPIRMRPSADIFALGCLYYFVLTQGSHIFGEQIYRNGNILQNNPKFVTEKLEVSHQQYISLMGLMVSDNPKKRPAVKKILKHHIFWSKKEQLDYLMKVSDMLTGNCAHVADINDKFKSIVQQRFNNGKSWKDLLTLNVKHLVDTSTTPKYQDSFYSLLRAIRNFSHHYEELNVNVKTELGNHPTEYLSYWISKFPWLLNAVFEIMNHFQVSVDFGKLDHDLLEFW